MCNQAAGLSRCLSKVQQGMQTQLRILQSEQVQVCSVKLAPNVLNVGQNLPLGARLNQFWEPWEALGAGPKVTQMLKEGYTLPFESRLNLGRRGRALLCPPM